MNYFEYLISLFFSLLFSTGLHTHTHTGTHRFPDTHKERSSQTHTNRPVSTLVIDWVLYRALKLFRNLLRCIFSPFFFFSSVSTAGMSTRNFNGIPTIQEVECSGKTLGLDLVGITLFSVPDNKIIAYVNVKDKECSTSSGAYSACVFDPLDVHKTRLITLVFGFEDSAGTRSYGCNVTRFRAGQTQVVMWSIRVQQTST